MKKADISTFFEILKTIEPEPKGELEHVNPYTLLVAVVLSAQATDKGVNAATRSLFAKVTTAEDMIKLGEEKLIEHIRTIGLYKTKAKNVMAAAKLLQERHNGVVPNNQAALEALPGVGRKTANVVRSMAFGVPTIAVDTHVFRVANRTGMAKGKNVVEVEEKLLKKIPKEYLFHAHHWLILHGRYTCLARKPKCGACEVAHICKFKDKTVD